MLPSLLAQHLHIRHLVLVVVVVVLCCCCAPVVDCASFPRPGRFIPAVRTPPGCTNCTNRLQAKDMVQQLRLLAIKQQILGKLGMRKKPTRSPTEIPTEVINKAIEQLKIGRRSKFPRNKESREGDGGYYAEISEIISFSEDANYTSNNVIKFSVADEVPDGGLAVTSANMWILIRYKKVRKVKNPTKSITIHLHRVGADGNPAELLTSLIVTVRHTRWQKVGLPTDIIQSMFESSNHQLHFLINCPNCPAGIEPVLVRKSARVRPRARAPRRVNAPRRKAPRRRNRVNKRRPFLVIRTKLKSTPHSAVRRSVSCSETSSRCCKQSLYVSFKDLGWDDWIIAPDGYFANYCQGKCTRYISPETLLTHHSTVLNGFRQQSRKTYIKSCCSPRKMAPLSMLYFDEKGNIVKTDLPRMVVEECGCT